MNLKYLKINDKKIFLKQLFDKQRYEKSIKGLQVQGASFKKYL